MGAISETFPGFENFSRRVYVYNPKNDKNGNTPSPAADGKATETLAPTTVVLFTWADGQARHIAKYIQGYQELYPSAKIILVRATTMSTFFARKERAQAIVRKMVETELYPELVALDARSSDNSNSTATEEDSLLQHEQAVHLAPSSKSRLLVHIFSNSGGINLEATCLVWRSLFQCPLPMKGLILDSTPGGVSVKTEFPRWNRGIAAGLSSVLKGFVPQFIITALGAILVTFLYGIPEMLGAEILPARCQKAINSVKNIPKECPRLYIYSDADPLIGWKDVEENAAKAKAVGFEHIQLEKFIGSTHVGHIRQDPERYWRVVKNFWTETMIEDKKREQS